MTNSGAEYESGTFRGTVRYATLILGTLVAANVLSWVLHQTLSGDAALYGTAAAFSLAMVAVGYFIGRDSAETELQRGGQHVE